MSKSDYFSLSDYGFTRSLVDFVTVRLLCYLYQYAEKTLQLKASFPVRKKTPWKQKAEETGELFHKLELLIGWKRRKEGQ